MPVIPYGTQTWTDGSSDASAARMLVIENGIKEVSLAPAVRAYHNAAQAITTATLTALAFNSERFDTVAGAADTMHDTVTNNSRLTCRYAGLYQITANVEFAANATGQRQLRIRHSVGPTYIGFENDPASSGTNGTVLTCTTLYQLAVNEYVEAVVYQDSGGNLNVNSTGNYSPEFSMVRVG